MCVTDLDLEIAEDEQAPRPGQPGIGGRYAGVAWGLVERHDDQAGRAGYAEAGRAEAGAEAGAEADNAEAGAGAARSR